LEADDRIIRALITQLLIVTVHYELVHRVCETKSPIHWYICCVLYKN